MMQMSPECTVTIVLRDLPQGAADAAAAALEPDNIGFPEGLSMRIAAAGRSMTLEFESRGGARVSSLASTIDEVLGHVQVALEVTRR